MSTFGIIQATLDGVAVIALLFHTHQIQWRRFR